MRLAAVPAREAALGDLTYDRASNLASWKLQSGTSATAVTAKHDAWNRLTEVSFGGTLRCRQAHNALHWRSFQLSDRTGTGSGAGAGPDGTMDQARLMSYGADWRLLEERIDDNLSLSAWNAGTWNPATDPDRAQQYVWGARYVDDVVLHRVDGNLDGDYADAVDGTWHHLTDAQFSSVCLVDDAGVVAERVAYGAYGTASHLWRGDINADGAVNSADLGFLLGAYGSSIGGTLYRSEIDLNRDGIINSVDLGALLGGYAAALAPGTLSSALVDNPIGWDGYVFDRESGLYTVRYRTYETALGRWMERDPAGYVDGANVLGYCAGNPVGRSDHLGLWDDFSKSEAAEIIRESRAARLAGPCCTATELTLELHTDWTYGQSPRARINLAGLSVAQVAQSLRRYLKRNNYCCIETLIIDAHGGQPGVVQFRESSDEAGVFESGVSVGFFDHRPMLNQPVDVRRRFEEREAVIAAVREILGMVCSGGKLIFLQCDAGRGAPGSRLGLYLAREAGRGIEVTLFSGACKFYWGFPCAVPWYLDHPSCRRRFIAAEPGP